MVFTVLRSLCFLVVVLAAHACASAQVLGKIESIDETITQQDFDLYVYQRLDLRAKVGTPQGKREAFDEMVLTRLLTLEGQRKGIPTAAGKSIERFDDIYAFKVLRALANTCSTKLSPDDLRRFYDENRFKFLTPATLRLWRIKVPKDMEFEEVPALKFINGLYEALHTGRMSDADAITASLNYYSMEPQGDLGWISDDASEQFSRLFTTEPGAYLKPELIDDHYYLFSVKAKNAAEPIPWEMAKAGLAERLYISECRLAEKRQMLKRLDFKYRFEVYGAIK